GQRKVIASLRAGTPVDPIHGRRGKQRSVHNTYFTLPVVLTMLSNHYGFAYDARHNWLVLVALMLAGALIRLSFVLRHKALVEARPVPWRWAIAGTLIVVATVAVLRPAPEAVAGHALPPPTFAEVQQVVAQRCQMCHNAAIANKGVRLDTAEQIGAHAQQIEQQAVLQKTMPLNNATAMTDAERALLGRWFRSGAPH
ncbi:MAG: urate hydroxylase PuuD, partial [Pseudomonadota bacterium]|nr:urate hydroxylase PuuD [Pseudomonadota bacterium]